MPEEKVHDQSQQSGPFSVEPVDPLVFEQSTDAPELRAAAAYIPISAKRPPSAPIAQPPAPAPRPASRWTPGLQQDTSDITLPPGSLGTRNAPKAVQVLFTAAAVFIPLALVVAAVYFGLSLSGAL